MTTARVLAVATLALACSGAASAADGEKLFADTCEACHQPGGVGAPGLAPPLVSPVIANAAGNQKDYPAMVVINGLSGQIPLAGGGTMASAMPPQQGLSDDEIAAVVTYVFGLNGVKTVVSSADIAGVRSRSTGHDELRRTRSGLMP